MFFFVEKQSSSTPLHSPADHKTERVMDNLMYRTMPNVHMVCHLTDSHSSENGLAQFCQPNVARCPALSSLFGLVRPLNSTESLAQNHIFNILF